MADKIKTEDVEFYNPHETLKRDEGVYLDVVERIHAEEQRAVREDREPDFDNMPAGAGTPLVTLAELPRLPNAVGVEPLVTLPVATTSPNAADEDQIKAAHKATEGVNEQVRQARLSNIKAESAAAQAAAKSREDNATQALSEEVALSGEANKPRPTPRDVAKRTASKRTAKK